MDNQTNPIQNYQPQIIQTSVSDKNIKDIGEMIVGVLTTINQIKQQGEIEIAKYEAETAKFENELYLEQMKSDERITTTLVKWDTYFKGIVLIISFGSIIAIQYLGGSTLTTTIVPVVTFILGSVFKNQLNDFIKVHPKKKRKPELSENEDE